MSVTRTLDAAVDACAATSRAFTPARDGAERALVVDGSAVLRRPARLRAPASVSMCAASESIRRKEVREDAG